MKPFKVLDEQISILENRGLSINDRVRAKEYLLTNNYYNVINTYSKYIQYQNDSYYSGASFDEITHIKLFDKQFKNILFKSILEAENHIASIISYRFSEKFKNKKYAYLKTESYRGDKPLKVARNIALFSKIINNNIYSKKANAVKHYYNNHGDVPIWVLINELTFGNIYHLFSLLDDSLQNSIAFDFVSFLEGNLNNVSNKEFNKIKFDHHTALSFIENLNEIRNIVAHDNKLLDYKCKKHTRYFNDLHSTFNVGKRQNRQDVYNVCICLSAFLSKNQFAQLHNTILKKINYLSNKLTTISVNVILSALGFPQDWNLERSKLEQDK